MGKIAIKVPGRNKKPFSASPPQVLVLGFAFIIMLGTLLLLLPVMTNPGKQTGLLTAFFTATSAVCVTGLVVVDTGTHWALPGQILIMLLVQVGGLGFMTMAMVFFIIMGRKIGLKNRLLVQESLSQMSLQGVVSLAKTIFLFALMAEMLATVLLSLSWIEEMGLVKAVWFGLFHSVSAFNNSGFDLFGNYRSLTGYVADPLINLIITTLIIIGGLGFSVVYEIWKSKGRVQSFSVHTRLVLVATFMMLLLGTLLFAGVEWGYVLKGLPLKGKLLVSYFQSVTTRTAGFNTVEITKLHPTTLFVFIIWMFIGASPGSTGGGIKITTFSLLLLASVTEALGHKDIQLYHRRIPFDQVYKALSIFILATFWVVLVTMVLTITEKADFLTLLFETVSAFGTVGLTMNFTPSLSVIGRLMIIVTMFLGKMGPLTVAFALASKKEDVNIKYPEEKIIVG